MVPWLFPHLHSHIITKAGTCLYSLHLVPGLYVLAEVLKGKVMLKDDFQGSQSALGYIKERSYVSGSLTGE
jgi:hypothetical protein